MCDLSWLEPKQWLILVRNGEELLADEPEEFDWFDETIDDVGNRWNEAIEIGEVWDRPSVPFHLIVVLKDATDDVPKSRFNTYAELDISG